MQRMLKLNLTDGARVCPAKATTFLLRTVVCCNHFCNHASSLVPAECLTGKIHVIGYEHRNIPALLETEPVGMKVCESASHCCVGTHSVQQSTS